MSVLMKVVEYLAQQVRAGLGQLLVQKVGRVDTARSGHRVELLKDCERSPRRSRGGRPDVQGPLLTGPSHTTLVDATPLSGRRLLPQCAQHVAVAGSAGGTLLSAPWECDNLPGADASPRRVFEGLGPRIECSGDRPPVRWEADRVDDWVTSGDGTKLAVRLRHAAGARAHVLRVSSWPS
jgi:hypothetical protein